MKILSDEDLECMGFVKVFPEESNEVSDSSEYIWKHSEYQINLPANPPTILVYEKLRAAIINSTYDRAQALLASALEELGYTKAAND